MTKNSVLELLAQWFTGSKKIVDFWVTGYIGKDGNIQVRVKANQPHADIGAMLVIAMKLHPHIEVILKSAVALFEDPETKAMDLTTKS